MFHLVATRGREKKTFSWRPNRVEFPINDNGGQVEGELLVLIKDIVISACLFLKHSCKIEY